MRAAAERPCKGHGKQHDAGWEQHPTQAVGARFLRLRCRYREAEQHLKPGWPALRLKVPSATRVTGTACPLASSSPTASTRSSLTTCRAAVGFDSEAEPRLRAVAEAQSSGAHGLALPDPGPQLSSGLICDQAVMLDG